MSGILYVVGTPIGNLEDITLRALRVLREVDLIAAEDTRHTRKLLSHFDIHTPLVAVHEHNEALRAGGLVQRLLTGTNMAYVTDAGMPVVSDPGERLVAVAVEAGVQVVPVPGPSAALAALAACGLPAARFVFEGFLSRRGRERREQLARLAVEQRAVVLFEAPGRVTATLKDLAGLLGDRPLAVARELTKRFEEVRRGTAAQLIAHFDAHPPRGEFTLVLAEITGNGSSGGGGGLHRAELDQPGPAASPEHLAAAVAALEQAGTDRKEAMRQVAVATGLSRRDVYHALLARTKQHRP